MQYTSKLELCKTTRMIITENEKNPNTTWSSTLRMFSKCITVHISYPRKNSWTLFTYYLFCGVITNASSETAMQECWEAGRDLVPHPCSLKLHHQRQQFCMRIPGATNTEADTATLSRAHSFTTLSTHLTAISVNEDHFHKLMPLILHK